MMIKGPPTSLADWGLLLLGVLIGTVGIIIARALAAGTRRKPVRTAPEDELHDVFQAKKEAMAERLSRAIRLKTVSYDRPGFSGKRAICAGFHDHGAPCKGDAPPTLTPEALAALHAGTAESEAELLKLHTLLQTSFPAMHRAMRRTVVNKLSLVYVWPGSDPSLQATCLMAHMDVVPADDGAEWTHPPFSGHISADGYVWGRGAIDDKQGVLGICEALEHLATSGFKPRRTIIAAFGHDEESGGADGAAHIAHWIGHNVHVKRADGSLAKPIAFILDEGLFVLEGAVPGMGSTRAALVCTAEKGDMFVQLEAKAVGGHSSAPPKDQAIGILSRALARLEANPFPPRFTGPSAATFAGLLPYLSFPFRIIFANLWLFRPLVARLLAAKPNTSMLVRTTTALTVVNAGQKANALPPTAKAIVNHRLLPGDSSESVLARDRAIVNDPRVTLTSKGATEASVVSDYTAPAFSVIAGAVERLFPNTVTAPSLMVGGTDCPWYTDVAEQLYRHCPTELKATETAMFHGRNERISVANFARIACFYTRVMMTADQETRF